MSENNTVRAKIFNIVAIVLCVIFGLILIVNCTLIVKGLVNEEEYPMFAGTAPMIVQSGSMEDVFPAGSLIFIKKSAPEEVEVGDIISYFDPQLGGHKVTTHKVESINKDAEGNPVSFVTYGTANVNDPRATIPADNLIGEYTGVCLKGLGNVAVFMQKPIGLIICVFIPLAALVGYDLIRRRIYEKKNDDDRDELMRELEELRELKKKNEDKPS